MTEDALNQVQTAILGLLATAQKRVLEKEQNPPTLSFPAAPDAIGVLPMPWANDEERRDYLHMARKTLRKFQAPWYVITSETWVASYSEDPDVRDLAPKDRSDRGEALMALFVPAQGEPLGFIQTFERKNDEEIEFAMPIQVPGVGGELISLFD